MNIIEAVDDILLTFPGNADIRIEFADSEPVSWGLSSIGDDLAFEDVLGNQRRIHHFLLYFTFSGINDYERLMNSSIITNLSVWLTEQTGAEVITQVGSLTGTGEIVSMRAGDGKLYEIPDDSDLRLRYQMSITAEYTVEL